MDHEDRIKEVDDALCFDMWEIIYEHLETDKAYVKRLGQLPFICKDRILVGKENQLREELGMRLKYLPLWDRYRMRGKIKVSPAYYHLNDCESLYSYELAGTM